MIVLLLKTSFILAVLLIFYKIILEKESFYKASRIYLVGSLLLTFLLPFVSISELVNNQGYISALIEFTENNVATKSPKSETFSFISENTEPDASNVELEPGSTNNAENSLGVSAFIWIILIYYFGVVVFSLNFLLQIGSVGLRIFRSKEIIKDTDSIIINTSGVQEPCSFFNYIFINPEAYDYDTYEQIVSHEKIHVRKLHTVDLLLSEIAIIILWFNPFVWILRKEVEKNIEYQTDSLLLEETNIKKDEYQMNLLRIATNNKPLTITTNYNQSLIKQRILKMGSKNSNPHSYWKYAFVFPMILAILLLLNKPYTIYSQNGGNNEILMENDIDSLGCKELLSAVKRGNINEVKELLKGSNPNCIYRKDGEPRTPLVAAAREGYLDIGKLLVDSDADVEFHAVNDETPLISASSNGHLEFVKFLISKATEVNKSLSGDGNALLAASYNGHLNVVEFLIEQGAEINQTVLGDGAALLVAAKNGHLETVQYLISKGAIVDLGVRGDGTPLLGAVNNGHYQIVKTLLENGADPILGFPDGESPIFLSQDNNYKKILSLLEKYKMNK